MKRPLVLIFCLLLLGVIGWEVSYHLGMDCAASSPHTNGQELEWLRREFKLTDEQFSQIKQLHKEYQPLCARLCNRVMDSQSKVKNLISQNETVTPEIQQALEEDAALKRDCQLAMLQHVYSISQVMSGEQKRRYLSMVEMQVIMPGCSMGNCSAH